MTILWLRIRAWFIPQQSWHSQADYRRFYAKLAK